MSDATKVFKIPGNRIDYKLILQIGMIVVVGLSTYFSLSAKVDVLKVELEHSRDKIETFVPKTELELQFKAIDDKLNRLLKAHGDDI